jgi:putative DNA primase/helicase
MNWQMTARELAARFRLHRSGNERGTCPACGYADDAFSLTEGRNGPIGWCASCGNQDAIAEAMGSPRKAATPRPPEKDARAAQARLERAEKLWRGGLPVLETAAAAYLNARGIGHLAACPELRFHSSCPHGGAVRLVPIEQVLAAGELVLGEGIETSGSAGLLTNLPAWAAVSAGNLATAVMPPAAVRILIAADRDTAGRDAARTAWSRFRREGRVVRVAVPDDGRGDFNNILRGQPS